MIIGVDEVGRGCWAGPVVAGAVMLRRAIPGLRDSKKLTKRARQELDILIRRRAVAFGLGWVAAEELDQLGMTAAVRLAMQRAVVAISEPYDQIIIDGNYNYLKELPGSECRVKADDSVPAVSAASILAKVARDAYMADIARQYPGYGFDSHVGYGTPAHREALARLGSCDLHRQSFAPIQLLSQANMESL